MSKLLKYNEFINESIRNLMTGKSDDEILKYLDDLTPYEILKKSSKIGYLNGVKIALERGVDPSVDRNYAIKNASSEGHIEIVKILLQDPRVDPSYDKNWTMFVACFNGHIGIVKLLLQDPRVDPSDNDNVAIKYAFKKNRMNIVQLLLQDKRVRNKLTKEEIKKYENKI